jgi:hypothetical protein
MWLLALLLTSARAAPSCTTEIAAIANAATLRAAHDCILAGIVAEMEVADETANCDDALSVEDNLGFLVPGHPEFNGGRRVGTNGDGAASWAWPSLLSLERRNTLAEDGSGNMQDTSHGGGGSLSKDSILFKVGKCLAGGAAAAFKQYWSELGKPASRFMNKPAFMSFTDSSAGVMALFPGVRSGSGSNDPDAGYAGYDARVTPWYGTGATGPKYVMLVLDVSRSTGDDGRLNAIRDGAMLVVDTLSEYDKVGVVAFSDTARGFPCKPGQSGCTEEGWVSATAANRKRLRTYIAGLQSRPASELTNYEAAMTEIFTRDGGFSNANCAQSKVVIFVTDGEPKEDKKEKPFMQMAIQENEHNARFVAFTFDQAGDNVENYGKRLACQHDGVHWKGTKWFTSLPDTMLKYSDLLAAGRSTTRWTLTHPRYEFLQDGAFSTDPDVWRGCRPVMKSGALRGVACLDLDLLHDDVPSGTLSGWSTVTAQFGTDSEACVTPMSTAASLRTVGAASGACSQAERSASSDFPSIPTPSPTPQPTPPPSLTPVSNEEEEEDTDAEAGGGGSDLPVPAIAGGVVGVLLFATCGCCAYKWSQQKSGASGRPPVASSGAGGGTIGGSEPAAGPHARGFEITVRATAFLCFFPLRLSPCIIIV